MAQFDVAAALRRHLAGYTRRYLLTNDEQMSTERAEGALEYGGLRNPLPDITLTVRGW